MSYAPWGLSPVTQPDGRDSHAETMEMIETALRKGSHLYEWTFQRMDGEDFYAEVSLSKVTPETEPPFLLAIVRDIAERKNIEKTLRDCEDRYKLSIESAQEAFGEIDLEGRIVSVNSRLEEMFGYRHGEMNGLHLVDDLIFQGDRPVMIETLQRRHRGEPSAYEQRFARKDGGVLWAIVSPTPIYDIDGNVTGAIAMMTDITMRKKAEDALSHSRELFKGIFDSALDGIIIADVLTKRLHMGNQTSCAMLGYTKEELDSLYVMDIHPENELPAVIDKFERQARGELSVVTQPVKRKDGSVFYADVSTALLTLNGRSYMIGIFRDITERQRLLDNLARADKLESLAVLAGGIAHDFNNLLTGVIGYIGLALEEAGVISPLSLYLTKAISVSNQAKNLAQQLLTFSKGGTPILKTGDLGNAVKESTLFALSGSNVSCAISIPEDLWRADFDMNQIGQVIGNLIINATQAMPHGGKVCIIAENAVIPEGHSSVNIPGKYIKITISDTGQGIPPEMLKRIFDPFFTTKVEGSGLGLTTSFSIIKQHGGYMDVESTLGSGTVFHLYLPASEKEIVTDARIDLSVHKGSGTILVMDDEPYLIEILEMMLKRMGYAVIHGQNGEAALSAIETSEQEGRPVDAAILDLTIHGGMGGAELIVVLRKKYPHIPIFATTGYSESAVMSCPEQFGFTDGICKPFNNDELSRLLQRHMKSLR